MAEKKPENYIHRGENSKVKKICSLKLLLHISNSAKVNKKRKVYKILQRAKNPKSFEYGYVYLFPLFFFKPKQLVSNFLIFGCVCPKYQFREN